MIRHFFGTNSFETSSKKMSEGKKGQGEREREKEPKSAPEITLNGDRWRITKDEGFEKG